MSDQTNMICLIDHPNENLTFSFEDDGKTGYAYLMTREPVKIVADVWLYNRQATPAHPEWVTRDAAPYRNSTAYTKSHSDFALPEREADIDVQWIRNADGRLGAVVLLRGSPIGELFCGDHPGRAKLALRDGPAARVFDGSRN
jgi:hypothetical protein